MITARNLLASQTVRVNNVKAALATGFLTDADKSADETSAKRRSVDIAGLTQSWLMDKDMNLSLFDRYLHWMPTVPLSKANMACLGRTTNVLLVVSLYQSFTRTPVVKVHLTTDSHRLKQTDPWTEEQLTMAFTFGQERLRIPDDESGNIPVVSGLFVERDLDGTVFHTESQCLTDGILRSREFARHKTHDFDEYLVGSSRPAAKRHWTNMTFTIGHVISQVINPYDQHSSSGQ